MLGLFAALAPLVQGLPQSDGWVTDLAGLLRDLEFECRHWEALPDLEAWRLRLEPQLRAAPVRARALAAEIAR